MLSCDVYGTRSFSATSEIGSPMASGGELTPIGLIDVHTVRVPKKNEGPSSRKFTVEQIQQIAELFKDVEAELWKLQRAIEARLPQEPLPPDPSTTADVG